MTNTNKTNNTAILNELITFALRQTIQAAVEAAMAGVAAKVGELEKHIATLNALGTVQEDALKARIQVLEDEVGRLQHANASRDQEREDIISDIIATRLEYALEDLDLTEQVRNVLSDATITI
jgi:uncharacterized small protein (DUF1192 family)